VQPSGFKLILLDYDGTLFDTRPAIIHCLRRSFEECGREVPELGAIANAVRAGATLSDTFLFLDPRLGPDRIALNDLVVTYRKFYGSEGTVLLHAFPGAAEMLQHLHRSGTKCVVISNKGIEAIRRSFDESGLSMLIDFFVADQPGIPKKPDPTIVTDIILPRYRVSRNEILIVGDTEVDILFAKHAGIASCWAAYGFGNTEHCRALAPDYTIGSIDELRGLVAMIPPHPPR
jgi:phosphoglycolate phosphatase